MKLLAGIANFYAALWKPPTLPEVIVVETEKTIKEVMQCDHVIKTHQFQRHMALRKLDAMEEWNHKERKGKADGN